MNDPTILEPEQTPQQRLEAAEKTLDAVNRMFPQGMQPIQPPPWTEPTAAVDALIRTLIAKGLISEQEFVEAKTVRMAEIVEEMAITAQEIKRQALGLVIARPTPSL